MSEERTTPESLGAKFKRDREARAASVAERLKYIMAEDVKAQTCCEGWDEAICMVSDLLLELQLKPPDIPLEYLTMKDMVELLRQAFKEV